nr:YdcF family protein [Isoptericola halotolerans]
MIRSERRSLGNLLSLLAGAALLTAPGVVVGLVLLDQPLASALATAVALGGAWLAYYFLGFVVQTWQYRRYARRVDARAVVVLGSRVVSGKVPPLLAARLRTAVEAARRLGDDVPAWLVASGGQGADETVPEGRAMATWLTDHGIPADRVLVEDRARTTQENLVFSATLLRERGIEPPYLVATNSYHAPRAALEALDLGIEAHAIGAPTAPYYFPSAYLREFVAVLRARRRVHVVVGVGILLAAALVAYAGWSA